MLFGMVKQATWLTLNEPPGRRIFSYLKEKLHSFDWSDGCFGNGSGNTASQEILSK